MVSEIRAVTAAAKAVGGKITSADSECFSSIRSARCGRNSE